MSGADRARSPADARITPEHLRKPAESPPFWGRAPACDSLVFQSSELSRGGGCVGALKDVIADGVALPSPMRFKATPTSARHGSRSPIPLRKSMQTRRFQRPRPFPARLFCSR